MRRNWAAEQGNAKKVIGLAQDVQDLSHFGISSIDEHIVRDIATFFEQPLQYGDCISDFQHGVTT